MDMAGERCLVATSSSMIDSTVTGAKGREFTGMTALVGLIAADPGWGVMHEGGPSAQTSTSSRLASGQRFAA